MQGGRDKQYRQGMRLLFNTFPVYLAVACLFGIGCRMLPLDRSGAALPPGSQVGYFGMVNAGRIPPPAPERPCVESLSIKAVAESLDVHRLMYSGAMVTDCAPDMLTVPAPLAESDGRDFVIARAPPEITFSIVPAAPRWPRVYRNQHHTGWWGNTCQSLYDPVSQTFYSAVGDYGGCDAYLYMVAFDPRARSLECPVEINYSIRRGAGVGDNMISGWLNWYRSSDLPRPHIWFCTGRKENHAPPAAGLDGDWEGGRIVSYDPTGNLLVDYGTPLSRAAWVNCGLDQERGMLYAVGSRGEFLAWNINRQRAEWAGCLPSGMRWNHRAMLVDADTGCVFTSNDDPGDLQRHMICYNADANDFSLLDCHMPSNPETGTFDGLAGHTSARGPDGLFWGVTTSGVLFSFDPLRSEVQSRGWYWRGGADLSGFTPAMVRSPGGRYLYYNAMSFMEGSPVIQYDTRTGTRKALAFLYPYYYARYGYIPAYSCAPAIDETGEGLFMVWNGAFRQPALALDAGFRGHCAVMYLKIPATERLE